MSTHHSLHLQGRPGGLRAESTVLEHCVGALCLWKKALCRGRASGGRSGDWIWWTLITQTVLWRNPFQIELSFSSCPTFFYVFFYLFLTQTQQDNSLSARAPEAAKWTSWRLLGATRKRLYVKTNKQMIGQTNTNWTKPTNQPKSKLRVSQNYVFFKNVLRLT